MEPDNLVLYVISCLVPSLSSVTACEVAMSRLWNMEGETLILSTVELTNARPPHAYITTNKPTSGRTSPRALLNGSHYYLRYYGHCNSNSAYRHMSPPTAIPLVLTAVAGFFASYIRVQLTPTELVQVTG